MVVTKVFGGLGNQLFQYSFGFSLAKRMNTSLYLDTSWFEKKFQRSTPRKFELNNFQISALPKSKMIDFQLLSYNNPVLKRLPIPRKYTYFKETNNLFQSQIDLSKSSEIYVEGYWQSYNYFLDYNNLLSLELKFNDSFLSNDFDILDTIKNNKNSVSVHIRRTDYVNNITYEQLGVKYYEEAIHEIQKFIDDPTFFIFSDDINYVKNNFNFKHRIVYIDIHELHNFSDIYSFYLMSLCSHNIIANSTFSWWAAWLNNNTSKIVISPKNWYKNHNLKRVDLIPNGWIQI